MYVDIVISNIFNFNKSFFFFFLALLVGRYVLTKVIRVRNKDKPWFGDQCRHAFGLKQEAHLRWTRDCSRVNWEEFVRCQVRANA